MSLRAAQKSMKIPGMTRILIACHCKTPIYYEEWKNTYSPTLTMYSSLIDPSTVEFSYIDKDENCPDYGKPLQYNSWEEIPDNYFDYIWFQYCPLFRSEALAFEIFNSALNKVKRGGKIMTILNEAKIAYLDKVFTSIKTPFTYRIIDRSELPFYMDSGEEEPIQTYYELIKGGPTTIRKSATRSKTRSRRHKGSKKRKTR